MFSSSTWLHLRFPFSFFLMPVYFFALAVSPNFNEHRIIWSFLIIHFLLYPASNAYNSYFDKDEKSIGGLKNPPPVSKGLYFTALLFDFLAILLGLKISLLFSIMLLLYGLASKAYSHPAIRLKRYPVTGWIITGVFQGAFSLLMCYEGINGLGLGALMKNQLLWAALLTSLMILGNYPMTQIYQHEEDTKRGDRTLSILLGIQGTFIFTAILFLLATAGFFKFFSFYFSVSYALTFAVALTPVLGYFLWWLIKVKNDVSMADYSKTMRLNFISAICLTAFFIYLFLDHSQVIQALKGGF